MSGDLNGGGGRANKPRSPCLSGYIGSGHVPTSVFSKVSRLKLSPKKNRVRNGAWIDVGIVCLCFL